MKDKKDVTTINPNFKTSMYLCMQTLTNFPFIEDDFDALTNYELLCKVVEYLNKIAANDNVQNENITALANAFNDLKDYVDNYLDHLDIQEDVNNKLDEMVEDGTLAEIINQEIFTELNSKVNANTEDIDDIETAIEPLINSKMKEIRKKYYSNYHVFDFPVAIPEFMKKCTIYESYDKKNYKYEFNKEELKVTGGNTYYVDSVNGLDSNDGTTPETAYKSITKAYRTVPNNSTIYVKKGIYYRDLLPTNQQSVLPNNLNIICDDNTLMGMFDNLTYTQNSQYPNVYESTRSNAVHALDIRGYENGVIAELQQVNSLATCADTLNSFYKNSSTVYINIGEPVDSTKVIVSLLITYSPLSVNCSSASKDLTLYLENATIINGNVPVLSVESSSSYQATFYGVNCKFLYKNQTNENNNGVDFLGSNSILYKCEASFNGKDGFNYHVAGGKSCNAIELDCIGSYNGIRTSINTCNGSTIHDGGKIIRIGGKYFNNKGANVADVQENTLSFNFNCISFDSLSGNNSNSMKCDFSNQQAGGTMYLYNCYSKGSNSKCNLFNHEDATMYISNCEYDTSDGIITEI